MKGLQRIAMALKSSAEIPNVGDRIETQIPAGLTAYQTVEAIVTKPASLRHNIIIRYLTGPKIDQEAELNSRFPIKILERHQPVPIEKYYVFQNQWLDNGVVILEITSSEKADEMISFINDYFTPLTGTTLNKVKQIFQFGGADFITGTNKLQFIGVSTSLNKAKELAKEHSNQHNYAFTETSIDQL